MNMLKMIDDELAGLEVRVHELQTARRVLLEMQKKELAITKKPPKQERKKRAGRTHVPNSLDKAREASLAYLTVQTEPKRSREILDAIKHLGIADSTMWKGLKELRDEGLIQWDDDTRQYSIVREEVVEKVAS